MRCFEACAERKMLLVPGDIMCRPGYVLGVVNPLRKALQLELSGVLVARRNSTEEVVEDAI